MNVTTVHVGGPGESRVGGGQSVPMQYGDCCKKEKKKKNKKKKKKKKKKKERKKDLWIDEIFIIMQASVCI